MQVVAAEGEATTRRASAQKERTLRVVRVVAGGFPYPGPPERRSAGGGSRWLATCLFSKNFSNSLSK